MPLTGTSIVVVGAGLAGLTAASQLCHQGAQVKIIEARSRVGGRVFTLRDSFAAEQHAEAGGDFIDEGHEEIIRLVSQHGLKLRQVLKGGFAFIRDHRVAGLRSRTLSASTAWNRLTRLAGPLVRAYRLQQQGWDSPFARKLAGQSVAQWLDRIHAGDDVRAFVRGLRGFFLADPEDLSLLVLIDQLASDAPGQQAMYRIEGGNDRLPFAMAEKLRDVIHLDTAAVAVRHDRDSVRLTVCRPNGDESVMKAHAVVFAIPASTLRSIRIRPSLPDEQAAAVACLKYGRVTKSLLQFNRRFWKGAGRASAYGTDAPTGALWDANEEQGRRPGILTLMAGGQASEDSRKLVAQEGVEGLVRRLEWLGSASALLLHSRLVTWEDDAWALGGYAYFDPAFDPAWRQWLARPHGRLFFCGEHTSVTWQGYMNGAVESGLLAAKEVASFFGERRAAGQA
ncbi:MAG TPA: NAD(P)/FAD-dependent oxidoreductase [Nitrospira sp.]|nr:NAD(P)/FAD-dependent oxidoreductase [Nitrospira sp.]